MPTEFSIPQLINIGKLSQVLAAIDNDKNIYFKGSVLDVMLPKKIYWVWKPLSLRYAANPNDSTLRQVGEWLFQLCGPYGLAAQRIIGNIASGTLPVLTGPTSVTINVGQNATFSVSASGTTPFTYQWFLNNVAIPGATSSSYVVSNAQLSQTGGLYSVQVTNSVGTVTSNTATLTVIAALVAYYYYGATDYSTQLQASTDNVPYEGTFPITSGQPLTFTWPSGAANNQYIVVKYPATESIKTTYANAPLNNGVIPSIAFGTIVTFGGWNYIYSRTGNPFSQNTAAPLIFS